MKAIKNFNVVGLRVILAFVLVMVTDLAQSASLPTAHVVVENPVSNPVPVHGVEPNPVLLVGGSTSNNGLFSEMKQSFPDGTIATDAFVVPTGQELVITDVTFAGIGLQAYGIMSIGIFNLASLQNTKPTVQFGPGAAFSFLDHQEAKSVTQSFSTGYVVSDQAKIKPVLDGAGSYNGGFQSYSVWVNGYLRPAL